MGASAGRRRGAREQANPGLRLGAFLRYWGALSAEGVVELGIALADALIDAEPGRPSDPPLTPDSFRIDPYGYVRLDLPAPDISDPRPGSRTWAAPEQLHGGGVGVRARIFSLGAILYQAATGDALFEAEDAAAAQALVAEDLDGHLMLAAVSGRLKAVQKGLDTIVLACLELDPKSRPETPALLRLHLEGIQIAPNRTVLKPLVATAQSALEAGGDGPAPNHVGASTIRTLADSGSGVQASATGAAPGAKRRPVLVPLVPPPAHAVAASPTEPPPAGPALDRVIVRDPAWDAGAVAVEPEPAAWELDASTAREEPTFDDEPEPMEAAAADGAADDGAMRDGAAEDGAVEDVDDPADPAEERSVPGLTTLARLFAVKSARVRPLADLPAPQRSGPPRRLAVLVGGLLVLLGVLAVRAFVGPDERGLAWASAVALLPPDLQEQILPPPDDRALLHWAGIPEGDGFLKRVAPTIEPLDGLPDAMGRLRLAIVYQGGSRPIEGTLQWTAEPIPDPRPRTLMVDIRRVEGSHGVSTAPGRATMSGEGLVPGVLPAGWWTLTFKYSQSETTAGWTGSIRDVRVAPGHVTTLGAAARIGAGRLAPRVLLDSQDSARDFRVSLYTASVAAEVQAAERASRVAARRAGEEMRPTVMPPRMQTASPLWTGLLSELPPMPTGVVVARLANDDGIHWPTVAWFSDVEIPKNMEVAQPVWALERGEVMNPSGPGVRLTATNLGAPVTGKSMVYLYRPGADVTYAAAVVQARAGTYADVPPGLYTLRMVYQPVGPGSLSFGERIIDDFRVYDAGVTERTVELDFPMAWLDLEALDGDEDVSAASDLVVVRQGVDRAVGTPLLDEEGIGRHVLPAGTYDIYVDYAPRDERAPIEAAFMGVRLAAGDRWTQRWQARAVPWIADAPRR